MRYRVHARTPVGRPDVVFLGAKVAVFVDGCQWHGCPVHYVRPRSNGEFWANKLIENTSRDRRQTLALEATGWRVVRVWEHDVYEDLNTLVEQIASAVEGTETGQPPVWRVFHVEPISEDGWQERRHLDELRDAEATRVVEGRRNTTKWRRPKHSSPYRS